MSIRGRIYILAVKRGKGCLKEYGLEKKRFDGENLKITQLTRFGDVGEVWVMARERVNHCSNYSGYKTLGTTGYNSTLSHESMRSGGKHGILVHRALRLS